MRVNIVLDARRLRRFHVELARRLSQFADVGVAFADVRLAAAPAGLETLFAFEARVSRVPPLRLAPVASAADLAAHTHAAQGAPDLIIDLCGGASDAAAPVWRLTYDGGPGEDALLAALLAGRPPLAVLSLDDQPVAAGRLGTESAGVLALAFEDGLARTLTLIVAAAAGRPSGAHLLAKAPAPALNSATLALFGAKNLARAIVRRLYRLAYQAPHWRVGWRKLDGPDDRPPLSGPDGMLVH